MPSSNPTANPVARYEAIADLYERRFHRLAPGKDSSMASGEESGSMENQQQFARWLTDGTAFEDAIARLIELTEENHHLKAEVYD